MYFGWLDLWFIHKRLKRLARCYQAVDGYSLVAESEKPQTLYGEVALQPFYHLLSSIDLGKKDRFYDLGSGLGKAVFVAADLLGVNRAIGIEQIGNLHQTACLIREQMPLAVRMRTSLLGGDFMESHLGTASCVFINATGWSEAVWHPLQSKLAVELKPGCKVLLVSKRLSAACFKWIWLRPIDMAYGTAHVNYYLVDR